MTEKSLKCDACQRNGGVLDLALRCTDSVGCVIRLRLGCFFDALPAAVPPPIAAYQFPTLLKGQPKGEQ